MVKVSIVVPTYKREIKILDRAINSLLIQTYENIEIIIVDDNATDELYGYRESTFKYAQKMMDKDNRIKYFQNEMNLGGALSRNVGIKLASGELIAFLDDDDLFLKDKIKHQVEFMQKNKLNCSFTDLSLYNADDKLIDRRKRNDIESFEKNSLIAYHLTKMITSTETFMISKQLLLDIGGFDNTKMGHEFYLMFKILNYDGLKIGYYPSDDIKAYRTKNSSISNSPNKIAGEKSLYQFKKKYFYLLNNKQIKYVRFRHLVVMSIAYFRNHKYFKSIISIVQAFFTGPILSLKETLAFKKRLKN